MSDYSKLQIKRESGIWVPYSSTSSPVHAGATRWTSVGKNLFDGNPNNFEVGTISGSTGAGAPSIIRIRTKDYIKIKTGSNYTIKLNGSGKHMQVFGYDESYNFVYWSGGWVSQVSLSNVQFSNIRVQVKFITDANIIPSDVIDANIQLEEGTVATAYEPYHDTHTTGTLPELRRLPNGTRDTYDLNTGVHTQRVGYVDLGTLDWTLETNHFYSDVVSSTVTLSSNSIVANMICPKYKVIAKSLVVAYGEDKVIGLGTNKRIYIYDSTYSDASTFKTAMDGEKLYYELATPIISYIDPELKNQDDEAVNFLLGGPSYTCYADIDGCPSPMTEYGTIEVIENDGGLSTEGIITITCDFDTSFLEIKLDDSYEYIRIEDTFLTNDVIEINLSTGSVTKNGTNILDKVTLASTLFDGTFKIPRGTSLLSLHGASELTLVFEEKWL